MNVPLIHQLFLCLNDETLRLVHNLVNSLALTINKEVLHESFSTTEPQGALLLLFYFVLLLLCFLFTKKMQRINCAHYNRNVWTHFMVGAIAKNYFPSVF